MTLHDPPEPPEGGRALRATDLKGKPCILRPVSLGEWPAKEAQTDEHGQVIKKARGPQPYVECDVWTFDRAGVDEMGTGVRISWWRAVAQLKGLLGQHVACRPSEQEDRSIILAPLTGAARDVAEQVVGEIEAGQHSLGDEAEDEGPVTFDESSMYDGSEPF